jgi:hypothetical protein
MIGEISSQLDLTGFGQPPQRRFCKECKAERIFRTVMRYKVLFVIIFGAISQRRFYFACTYCNNGPELDRSTVNIPLSKIPLSFLAKYGLAIVLCVVLLGILWQGIVSLWK